MTACTPDFTNGLVSYMPALRRYALRLTRNNAGADDLVQDCMLRALTKSHQFMPGTNLRAWLFTIMHSTFVNGIRRPANEVPLPEEGVGTELSTPATQEARVELGDFMQIFGRLSPTKQETVTLIAWHGESYEAVAATMGVPVGTVRSRLSRVREELQGLVDGAVQPAATALPAPANARATRSPRRQAATPRPALAPELDATLMAA